MAMPRIRSVALAASMLAALLPGPVPAAAATVFLRALLTGHQEVPANTSRAFGTAVLELDDVSRQLKANLTIGGLSGTLSAAHIHGPALTGVNAPIIFTLLPPGTVTTLTLTPASCAARRASR